MKVHKYMWLVVILIITSYLFIRMNNSSNTEIKYNSINEMRAKSFIDIDIPKFVYNSNINDIKSNCGLITISGDNFILKISAFVNVNADVLGIYDTFEKDYKYSVINNKINFLRYRTFNNETLINWCTSDTQYGMIMHDIISLDNVLSMLNIEECDISEYVDNTYNDNIQYKYLDISFKENNIKFYYPSDIFDIQYIEVDDSIVIFIDGKIIFIISYDKNKDTELSNKSEYSNGMTIYYYDETAYNKYGLDYINYDTVLSTVEYNINNNNY